MEKDTIWGNINPIDEGGENSRYPVRPESIDADNGLCSTFGKSEVEQAAGIVVKYCQKRDGWYSFTLLELIEFCKEIGFDPNMNLYGLAGVWQDDSLMGGIREAHPSLVLWSNGRYCVTEEFILRCAKRLRK